MTGTQYVGGGDVSWCNPLVPRLCVGLGCGDLAGTQCVVVLCGGVVAWWHGGPRVWWCGGVVVWWCCGVVT